jgi:hypothetical protein
MNDKNLNVLPTIELWPTLERPRLLGEVKPFKVTINPADHEHGWLEHVVLLPWFAPQRMIGFIHPNVHPEGGEPFMLHSALMYNAQHGLQPTNGNQMRVVEGPKICLPYDLISPVDIRIYRCPSAIYMRDQAKQMRDLFASMLLQILAPTSIELANPNQMSRIAKV